MNAPQISLMVGSDVLGWEELGGRAVLGEMTKATPGGDGSLEFTLKQADAASARNVLQDGALVKLRANGAPRFGGKVANKPLEDRLTTPDSVLVSVGGPNSWGTRFQTFAAAFLDADLSQWNQVTTQYDASASKMVKLRQVGRFTVDTEDGISIAFDAERKARAKAQGRIGYWLLGGLDYGYHVVGADVVFTSYLPGSWKVLACTAPTPWTEKSALAIEHSDASTHATDHTDELDFTSPDHAVAVLLYNDTTSASVPAEDDKARVHSAITLPDSGTTEVTTGITDPPLPSLITLTGNHAAITGTVKLSGTDEDGGTVTDEEVSLDGKNRVSSGTVFATVTKITVPMKTNSSGDTVEVGWSLDPQVNISELVLYCRLDGGSVDRGVSIITALGDVMLAGGLAGSVDLDEIVGAGAPGTLMVRPEWPLTPADGARQIASMAPVEVEWGYRLGDDGLIQGFARELPTSASGRNHHWDYGERAGESTADLVQDVEVAPDYVALQYLSLKGDADNLDVAAGTPRVAWYPSQPSGIDANVLPISDYAEERMTADDADLLAERIWRRKQSQQWTGTLPVPLSLKTIQGQEIGGWEIEPGDRVSIPSLSGASELYVCETSWDWKSLSGAMTIGWPFEQLLRNQNYGRGRPWAGTHGAPGSPWRSGDPVHLWP